MNDQTVRRENLLFRYSTALELGDFDTIIAILQSAESDPVLERMILAVNEEYYRELAAQHPLPDKLQIVIPANLSFVTTRFLQSKPGENRRAPANTGFARRQSQRLSIGLAAALLMIAFFALIFINVVQRQFGKTIINPPLPTVVRTPPALTAPPLIARPGKIAVMTTSRDDKQTSLYIMRSPESQPTILAGFSGTIAEATGQVAWSPDGTRIAFNTCENGSCDLYVIHVDGTQQRKLAANIADFSWSPDSHQLIFCNLNGQLFTIKDTDQQPSPLNITIDNSQNSYPSWSPDGKQIAFLSNHNNGEIYVMAIDGRGILHLVAQNVHDAVPNWSPDSHQLVFVVSNDSGDKVVTVDVNNSQQRVIVDAATNSLTALGRIAKWSPDGKTLVFTAYRQDAQIELYLVDNQSLNLRRLTQTGSLTGAFAWSPDGSRLIFDGQCNQTQGLYMVNVDGSDQQCLTSFARASGLHVDWTP